jgi:predicted dehydrogenase
MHVSMNFFQAKLPKALSWAVPPENFSNMMAIFAGHFLDALFAVVGQPADLTALAVNQFSEITIVETGEKIKTTNPDEVVVTGTLVGGGVFTFHLEGGKRNGSGVQIDITGDEGDLQITNASGSGGVGGDLIIRGAHGDNLPLEVLPVPKGYNWLPPLSCRPMSSNSRTSTSLTPATSPLEHVSLPHSRTRSECTPSSI